MAEGVCFQQAQLTCSSDILFCRKDNIVCNYSRYSGLASSYRPAFPEKISSGVIGLSSALQLRDSYGFTPYSLLSILKINKKILRESSLFRGLFCFYAQKYTLILSMLFAYLHMRCNYFIQFYILKLYRIIRRKSIAFH